ncbi:MAG: helix-turn-helix transcriptional regulator [Aquaticitalea sp.]
MNIIQVRSLPLKDVIIGFAKSFGTDYSENCGDFRIDLPDTWGKGHIRGINFEGGMGILQYSCSFNEDLEIQFVIDEVHPLKYLFCLDGELKHHFANESILHTLDQFQNVIVASEGNNGHILKFEKAIFTDIYSVEIDRKKFKSKMACEIILAEPKLQIMFADDHAKQQFYYKGLYSLVLAMLFQEIKEFAHTGLINKLFLEGKAYQILANQLIQYADDDKHESDQNLLRKSEVKSILEAVAIIESNLDSLGSIRSIAQRVGINGNKIQNGFKSMYGMTVNSYIQKNRLEMAKNLLLNTNYPIQEIMQKVGWNSKSYFSKIFKETYKSSPSDFRNNHNGHKIDI